MEVHLISYAGQNHGCVWVQGIHQLFIGCEMLAVGHRRYPPDQKQNGAVLCGRDASFQSELARRGSAAIKDFPQLTFGIPTQIMYGQSARAVNRIWIPEYGILESLL